MQAKVFQSKGSLQNILLTNMLFSYGLFLLLFTTKEAWIHKWSFLLILITNIILLLYTLRIIAPFKNLKPFPQFKAFDLEQRKLLSNNLMLQPFSIIVSLNIYSFHNKWLGLVFITLIILFFVKEMNNKSLEDIINKQLDLRANPPYLKIFNDKNIYKTITFLFLTFLVLIGLTIYYSLKENFR